MPPSKNVIFHNSKIQFLTLLCTLPHRLAIVHCSMQNNQSINDLIKAEPYSWVNAVMKLDTLPELTQRLSKTRSDNRRAIIQARIDNISYLAS